MPRYRPDGSQNAIRFQRLKDKLGNKSNASSEVEFHGAYAERVGAEGAGVRTIIEMVNLTRLDCAIASAGQMRFGLSQALNHIRNRSVFQSGSPTSRRCAPSWPTWRSSSRRRSRWCSALPRSSAPRRPRETAYARLLTPAVKFLVCKSTPQIVYEALECLGGNGYTEDLPMARLYREAPLNAIWEGSGNVMALDVLRAAGRAPDAAMETVGALVRTASTAFDVRPLAEALEQDAEVARRRAPRALPVRGPGAARRAGRAGRGQLAVRHALRRRAPRRLPRSRSSAPPISAAPRPALMDRALAA